MTIPCTLIRKILPVALLFCAAKTHAQSEELSRMGSDYYHRSGTIPTFFARDSAKGSPWLTQTWVRGTLELSDHRQLPERGHAMNFVYDKLQEHLLATDGKTNWDFPRDSILSFSLFDSGNIYTFVRLDSVSPAHLLQTLVRSEKGYSLYRRITTKVILADYRNAGYYATGRRYDEFKDVYEYFITHPGRPSYKMVRLSAQNIRKALQPESPHFNIGPFNEQKLILLVRFINDSQGN